MSRLNDDPASPPGPTGSGASSPLDALALGYIAVPNAIFLAGWIVAPLGPIAAVALLLGAWSLARSERHAGGSGGAPRGLGVLWVAIVPIAALWVVLGGLGHFVYANADWVVRDAVLVDLVRDRWPVLYDVDGQSMVLHAPIAYFLPAAAVGKLHDVVVAEYALLAWTIAGVALTFGMMCRDRPPLKAALVRLCAFIAFSGMDIVGTVAHLKPHALGQHLEWWAYAFQYSSQTTQLFWVPNHALPGWIAMAWLVGRDGRRLPIGAAVLFVACMPLWSPLTAIGVAPIFAVAIALQIAKDPLRASVLRLLDARVLVPVLITLLLICPYLVSGTETIVSEWTMNMRWIGEDFAPRYMEFVLLEFAGFAVLLLRRDPRDLPLWIAVGVLLALPFYRYGVYNDLAMRASIAPLALIALRLGQWLSTPATTRADRPARFAAVALLCIGAATPFMEIARAFVEPAWPMNTKATVVDVIRGAHYIMRPDLPWIDRILKHPAP